MRTIAPSSGAPTFGLEASETTLKYLKQAEIINRINLIEMASRAGVPYVMPNFWGTDPLDARVAKGAIGKQFGKCKPQ